MDTIEELLTRGVDKIYPSKEELEKVLRSGKKIKLYQGFDPTGSQLHIGHMTGLQKLKQWQKLGHEVIFLIGDFTGMIGDPSGKTTERKMLTREEVLENAKSYKEQAGKILNFDGENPVRILYNSEWLGKMSAIEFLRLARNLTISQIVERDMFQVRMKQGQDIFMNEFLYPFLQAYDSVAMDVDLEIGGSDQMFNMMMGRKLMRNIKQKEKYVMTTPLLTDSEGKKIGKTEGNVIGLTDTPEDLFGKVMGLGDDVIVKCLEYLTDIPLNEIHHISEDLKGGQNPIQYKKLLAYQIVKQLNSDEDAKKAQDHFERTVQQKELPTEIPDVNISNTERKLEDLVLELGLANSRNDSKRLIEQGGIEVDNQRITNPNEIIKPANEMLIKAGKRRVVRIKN